MLTEICGLFALFSRARQRCFDFWNAVLINRYSGGTSPALAGARRAIAHEGRHPGRRPWHPDYRGELLRPKPMVEIGGKPILWHIMKIYSAHGINDFIVCCGYKGYFIKEYFANYFLHMSDVTFDMEDNSMIVHQQKAEPWRVTLVDTGEDTLTGGRLKRVANYIEDEMTSA